MENLGEAGFKMENKKQCLDVAQSEIVMKAIWVGLLCTYKVSQEEIYIPHRCIL